jgi:hypothetical protein
MAMHMEVPAMAVNLVEELAMAKEFFKGFFEGKLEKTETVVGDGDIDIVLDAVPGAL